MRTPRVSSADGIVRIAARIYAAPRIAIGLLLLAAFGLAALLVSIGLAATLLHRLGA